MQLAHDHGDALQHVDRLEPGDHAGDAVLLRQELEGGGAGNGGHVTGQDERVELERRVVDQLFQGAGHVLVRGKHAEVAKSHGRGAFDGHGHQRRGGFEADAHEDDLTLGVLLGQRERIERAVADFDAASRRLLLEQARRAAGHARHVAERGDGDVGDARERDDGVDVAVRRDAHRAAGAGGEAHALGHEVADAVARDGDRVRAADFHERDLAVGRELGDGVDQPARELRVLEGRQLRAHLGIVGGTRMMDVVDGGVGTGQGRSAGIGLAKVVVDSAHG